MATKKLTAASNSPKKLSASQLKAMATTHSDLVTSLAAAAAQPDPFLGHAHAVIIVCACAQTSPTNLPRTLAQLGVNGIPFQRCVSHGVDQMGYSVTIDDIPNTPGTSLLDVVTVIQNAPRKG